MVRYENTSHERIELVFFYESELGQPLLEQIRTCSASTLSRCEEGHKAKVSVLLSVLLSDDRVTQLSDRQSAEGTRAHAQQSRYLRRTITPELQLIT
jgi:hypothetical protein